MKDSDRLGAFLTGFLLGGLTGAVIALLTAPRSGEETRILLWQELTAMQDQGIRRPEEEASASGDIYASEPFGPGGGRPGIED